MYWDLKTLNKQLFTLLFPSLCLNCGKQGELMCKTCLNTLDGVKQVCIVCKKHSPFGLTHLGCQELKKVVVPKRTLFACNYSDPVAKTIIAGLKYESIYELTPIAADIIIGMLAKEGVSFGHDWVITYVPLHPRREAVRSFNQSHLIAREISDKLSLPLLSTLVKIKATKPQTHLTKPQRLKNVKDAFQSLGEWKDKNIILVDDYFTTGATINECSSVLLRSGAKQVLALTLARD